MSPRLFLHRDCIVSPLFLSLRWLDGLSGSTGAYMQDPLITIRVVIFALWRKERTSLESTAFGLTPSHQVFMWIMAPISAILQSMDNWLILVSSELVTSVSRRGIRSLPFMARPPPDGSTISCVYSRIFCQPHLLQRPSGIVSWATYRYLVFSSLTGCSEGGCSGLASRINGISWTTSFRSPGSLSVESFLPWWTRVAQLREGVSFSSPVQEVSFLSDASDVDCRPS